MLRGGSVPHPCLAAVAAAAASEIASSPGHGCPSPAPPRSGLAPTQEWPEKHSTGVQSNRLKHGGRV